MHYRCYTGSVYVVSFVERFVILCLYSEEFTTVSARGSTDCIITKIEK